MQGSETSRSDGNHSAFENHEHRLVRSEKSAVEATIELGDAVDASDRDCYSGCSETCVMLVSGFWMAMGPVRWDIRCAYRLRKL
jgi:hypothetical protein